MSIIHPSTLYHFTGKSNNLKLILRNGLRFSYCFEEFTKNVGIAIPMICFCDIPLLRTIEHRHKYGDYMIGIDKEFLRRHPKHVLNPVAYHDAIFLRTFSPESFNAELEIINDAVNHFFEKDIVPIWKDNKDKEIDEILNCNEDLHYKTDCVVFAKNNFMYNLAFTKLYSKIIISGVKRTEQINYDEREWRYVPFFYSDEDDYSLKWIQNISLDEYESVKQSLQQKLHKGHDAYLTLKADEICAAINFIVVKYKRQIPSFINLIMNAKTLFGTSNVSKEQRELLITKIISFEDIEKNF